MLTPFPLTNCAVTGAGSGIGRAIALALAAAGSRVCVTDLNPGWAAAVAAEVENHGGQAIALPLDVTRPEQSRAAVAAGCRVCVTDLNPGWAAAVAAEVENHGGQAIALPLDVTRPEQSRAAVAALVERWGSLDLWVNNAGVSSMNRFLDLTEQDWDYNLDVNAKGVFFCSQAAVRQMLAQPRRQADNLRGKIVNVASMAGKRGNAPFLAHYVASKFAVVGLTQALAGELAPQGVAVNAVCPGYVSTGMQSREAEWEAALRGLTPQEVLDLYVADTPLGRLETPEDVAGVVLFLASPAAGFITGEALNVNGGSWMD